MIKSPAEIALMQRANDITLAAIGASFKTLKEGMTQPGAVGQRRRSDKEAGRHRRRRARASSASTPRSRTAACSRRSCSEGDVVLIDAGCTVDGYTSDITRTTVFGKPTQRHARRVGDREAARRAPRSRRRRSARPCDSVDAAARKVITDAGFGPDYKVPGLPHRTGHGIGIDGHEWTNFVRGNMTKIQPGMCFSDEPTIVIYGEFGIRLEDCLHITESGPKFFTPQSPSIEQPV